FAGLGLLLPGAFLVLLVALTGLVAGACELELRHARQVVPGPLALVVIAARLHQLLVQVAGAVVVLERVGEELLVGLLDHAVAVAAVLALVVLERLGLASLGPLLDGHVLGDVVVL